MRTVGACQNKLKHMLRRGHAAIHIHKHTRIHIHLTHTHRDETITPRRGRVDSDYLVAYDLIYNI